MAQEPLGIPWFLFVCIAAGCAIGIVCPAEMIFRLGFTSRRVRKILADMLSAYRTGSKDLLVHVSTRLPPRCPESGLTASLRTMASTSDLPFLVKSADIYFDHTLSATALFSMG
jgi:hypothetical protein